MRFGEQFGGQFGLFVPVVVEVIMRVIPIKCVLPDGSGPRGSRITLTLAREDVRFDLAVTRANGMPFDIAGATITMTIIRRFGDSPVIPAKLATLRQDLGLGFARITFTEAEIRALQVGRYLYDIWLSRDNTRVQVVPVSVMVLRDQVG